MRNEPKKKFRCRPKKVHSYEGKKGKQVVNWKFGQQGAIKIDGTNEPNEIIKIIHSSPIFPIDPLKKKVGFLYIRSIKKINWPRRRFEKKRFYCLPFTASSSYIGQIREFLRWMDENFYLNCSRSCFFRIKNQTAACFYLRCVAGRS